MSDQVNNKTRLDRLSYLRWPIGIVLFFIVLAVFNVVLAFLAFRSNPALVDRSPYEKGMAYQKVIDQITRAADLQIKAEFNVGQARANGQRTVAISIKSHTPTLQVHGINARFYYPHTADFDSKLDFKQQSADRFEAEVPLPRSGLCFVEVVLDTSEGKAFIKDKLWLQ